MRTEAPAPIRLGDYRPPDHLVDSVRLDIALAPVGTRVRAELDIRRNGEGPADLVLEGGGLRTVSVALDGAPLGPDGYVIEGGRLTVKSPPARFRLETEVEIDPETNTALDGLYMSGGRFCTQCEPEGFRKITWFPDRPDVLSRFEVRMEADQALCPRLLCNGNLVESGAFETGRHFAVWRDPFPKPSYLFALVAGALDVLEDSFVTASGRTVALRIYVDEGMAPRAAYAMDALKRSMRWDETAYGREYDLDLFMIVAVRDFNFGAMENKGLNIFNSALLLADPRTATDLDYERIESVVAHEYFHNWTGNRVTCRDWFQLCLKEGLTVFRDQSFSADQRGAAVQRIKDVRALRARQFLEDGGPLAHPVRPSSYLKIDNFYTATVYEKGSELIRMLHTLLGPETYRAAMDLYFERWDGHATTVEAFVACFSEASGRDLSAFFRWWLQPGTPALDIAATYDAAARTLTLDLTQSNAAGGEPLVVPLRIGLLDDDGRTQSFRAPGADAAADSAVITFETASARIVLEDVAHAPVLSPLRGFSAPVRLSLDEPPKDRYVRLAADPDLFSRWEAGQDLARDLILSRAEGRPDEVGEERYAEALGRALHDQSAEAAFKALLLALPSEGDLAQAREPVEPEAIHTAREALRSRISVHLTDELKRLHSALQSSADYTPDAEDAGRRALRNAALDLLAARPDADAQARALGHYRAAANMTDMMGGLNALSLIGGPAYEEALADFFARWRDEPLVIDKWFALQARSPGEDALGRVLGLTAHPAFDPRNPNRFRALVQTFAQGNPTRFHDPSGAGYRFVADQVLAADRINPSLAARLVESFGDWRRYAEPLSGLMRAELERIAAADGLSGNTYEQASRALG